MNTSFLNLTNTRFKPFLLQTLLWSGFAAIVIAAHSTMSANRNIVANILVRTAELAVLYNAHQYLFERYFTTRRYRLYAGLFACVMMLCGIALQVFRVWNDRAGAIQMWNLADIVREILAAGLFFMMVMGVVVFLRHAKNRYALQEAEHEARALKAASELKMLQAQINPHFLFNTLHSLYSLVSVRSEASQDKAQEVIIMLSDLMRYTYQTANAETVSLSEEVESIGRFLALHRIRFGKRAELHFEAHGNLDAWRIPPLLLLTFIENAVKHGIETIPRGARLDAHLEAGEELYFTAINTKVCSAEHSNTALQKQSSEKTGLQNVRRRLELFYPNCSALTISETESSFRAEIRLWQATREGS